MFEFYIIWDLYQTNVGLEYSVLLHTFQSFKELLLRVYFKKTNEEGVPRNRILTQKMCPQTKAITRQQEGPDSKIITAQIILNSYIESTIQTKN